MIEKTRSMIEQTSSWLAGTSTLDLYAASKLVRKHAKRGSMVEARRVFDSLHHRDLALWNALILGYAENGEPELALELFSGIQSFNERTILAAIKACACIAEREVDHGRFVKIKALEKGMAVHRLAAREGCDSNDFVASSLVFMYCKCGCLREAERVFSSMIQSNAVAWSSLMHGYADNGLAREALNLFEVLQLEHDRHAMAGDPWAFVAAAKACAILATQESCQDFNEKLVPMESLEKGMAIYARAIEKSSHSSTFVSNSLIDMFLKCGSVVDAQRVFTRMEFRGEPNSWTFVAALKACSNLADLETGREIHKEICRRGMEVLEPIVVSLLDFYGRNGSLRSSQLIFDSLSSGTTTILAWNALIAGYSHQGNTKLVFHLFQAMEAEFVAADGITFAPPVG
ncbi:pentatricopeptide repeat-containing protein At1g11290, chloroplastic-like [Selaginella moellendorffii]|uniref:pentatricopeptide repeat-containing protein At1g11290, chloroplastic-like n=1 Tax=Selaginella moellendorffii TaxID=88036 RepID=UPI000D1CA978|nr:pentatricopeptide repeat-containing protein At1g11290, chloroplastic-like [Selaginella moellendorffii]|eukprot:XP_024539162.1 pentatricopeptide repeat-containing protein At1g11290, chloroplastic-like [Selaginella moellendorffii]